MFRLVEEEQSNHKQSSDLALQQAALHKELKQCNVLLDAQKVTLRTVIYVFVYCVYSDFSAVASATVLVVAPFSLFSVKVSVLTMFLFACSYTMYTQAFDDEPIYKPTFDDKQEIPPASTQLASYE